MSAVAMKESNSQTSWQMTTLGDLRGEKLRNINPMDYPDEIFELWSVPSHSEGKPEIVTGKVIGSAKQSVVPDTVLLSKINPRINRVWIVADKKQYKQIASPEWIAFPPSNKVYPKYLMYFMQTQKFRDYLCMNVSGVGGSLTRARPKAIDDYEIPLAPPEQQKQIVAKIEELFSHIDAGIDALKQSKKLLKQYRQSVLKAAVTGELSKEWREQNKDKLEPASKLLERILHERRQKWEAQQLEQFKAKGKVPKDDGWKAKYKEPSAPDASDLPELPEGWCWASVEQLGFVDVGYAFKSAEFEKKGIRLLRGENMEPGRLRWDDTRYWPKEKLEPYLSLMVKEGEIILAMDRPLISSGLKIARVAEHDLPCLLLQRMARFNLVDRELEEYLYGSLNTENFINYLFDEQTGTQLPHISAKQISGYVFGLPPIPEQKFISQEIDKRITAISAVEKSIDYELQRSERLKQSVLQSAFGGGLI